MSETRIGILAPLPPGAYARRPRSPLPFPLAEEGVRVLRTGRYAVRHAVGALGLDPGDEILVPAYHHGSEVEAVVRAGLTPRFYDGTEALEPETEELDRLAGPRTRALYLIHFLGFSQDAPRWRAWCDARGLRLVEDALHAWPATWEGRPVGAWGDAAVFGLYTAVGVPDGAAALVRGMAGAPEERSAGHALGAVARRHAAWAAHRSGGLASLLAGAGGGGQGSFDAAAAFALGRTDPPASDLTRLLLPRLAETAVAERRRAAYGAIAAAIDRGPAPPFDQLGGASPFVVPVETEHKRALLARLSERRITGLDVWSVPHPSLPARGFPNTARRRARTVGLPCHQELRRGDVERIATAASRRPRSRALLVEPLEDIGAAREEWTPLAVAAGNVFATWEWASTWWSHHGDGDGGGLLLRACRHADGRLAAVLPMHREARGPARMVRFLGHGPADQLGPVCRPADRALAAEGLRRFIREELATGEVLVAERLPGDEGWVHALGGRSVRRESSPVLARRGRSWDGWLASRSANFRQQLRRRERHLVERRGLRFRLTADPAALPADLETLFRLHDARWEGSSTGFAAARSLHRDFAALALERGWLRLWIAEAEGRPVAAWYGFRVGEVEWYYQAGRDPAWEREAVGAVLLAHTIRSAFEDGVAEYRLGLGGEDYKRRFSSHDPALDTVVAGTAAAGAMAAAARAGRRLPLAVRERLT
jgi:CelD/BcsL family acetyltransferase involved in cellulose biosynthesis